MVRKHHHLLIIKGKMYEIVMKNLVELRKKEEAMKNLSDHKRKEEVMKNQ